MSRCFPFPPPGYELRLRSEHKDLLKKEKHKAKKHKKEATDGGERERKEKDRIHKKDKHKKKHKREKYKDRRKNKEGDKDKGQEGHANNTGISTGKLLPQSVESLAVAGSEEKERTSVGRVNEKSGQIGQHNHANEKWKDKTRVLNGKNPQGGPSEKHSTGIHGSNRAGLQQESAAAQQKHGIAPSTNAARRTEQVDQQSDCSSHSVYGKSDSISTKRMTEKKNGSTNNFHSKVDKQLVGGKTEAVQGNAKIKQVKANHQKGVIHGDRGHDVNNKAFKDRGKAHNVKKRKAKDGNESKIKEKRSAGHEQKREELDGHGTRKNHIHEMDSSHLNGNQFSSDAVKKRKDLSAKSSLHEHSMRRTKMPRMSPANHLRVNEETLKNSQGTAPSSTLPVGATPCKADMLLDNNECYNNSNTGPHHLEEHKSAVSSSSYDSREVSLTPPHPDTKYLSQVYSIPAVGDCSEFIDQDWLFSGDHVHQKSTILEAAKPLQVWSEAKPIDSADVIAMPYVVPL
uniref:Uncharacterized protein n=1 Tax=Avena sativa TaxID=4498 RepID=A0ACD6AM06_AVESA